MANATPKGIAKPVKKPPQVFRDVHFYRAVPIKKGLANWTLDLTSSLQSIKDSKVPLRLPQPEDKVLTIWVHDVSKKEFLFGSTKNSDLPMVDNAGTLTGIDIPDTAGLVDLLHIKFFDNNIVGIVSNSRGPKASQVCPYLQAVKVYKAHEFTLKPLLRSDVQNEIANFASVNSITMQVDRNFLKSKQSDENIVSLQKRFKSLDVFTDSTAETIEIRLKAKKGRGLKGPSKLDLKPLILAMLNESELLKDMTQFKVEGYPPEENAKHEINLLHEFFMFQTKILKENRKDRALDKVSAFSALDEYYNDNKDRLEHAVTLEKMELGA